MTVVGMRVSNTDCSYCVMSGNKETPAVDVTESFKFAKGLSEPDMLRWLYQEVEPIFNKHSPSVLALKKAETTVRRSNSLDSRIQCEAIVILAAGNSGCKESCKKVKATIAKDLGLKGKAKYLSSKLDTGPIPNFDNFPDKMQEAILVAWSSL